MSMLGLLFSPGTLPEDFGVPEVDSPLSDLNIGQNMLYGALNLSYCSNMIVLQVTES